MPLTMDQILRNTESERIQKARTTVRVHKLKLAVSKSTKLPLAITQTFSIDRLADGSKKVNKYVSMMLFMANKNVKISCSCDDFKFRMEWALWRKGASDIMFSNGDPPDVTNPAQIGGACKHLVAMWDLLKEKKLVQPAYRYANTVKNPTPNALKDVSKQVYRNSLKK